MRLWHKDLIPYLPRQQLLEQWRECCAIAKSISETGTPNHILVNKIMDYPLEHFYNYCVLVCIEMEHRGYLCDFSRLDRYFERTSVSQDFISKDEIFTGWHNSRYLAQCFYNLQEKYDCGGIPEEEWKEIRAAMI